MPTYTNNQVDSLASAVPAPYGPLTRVTDIDDNFPEPNDMMLFEFTDNNSNTIWAHYHELNDSDRILEILYEANGHNAIAHGILSELTSILADHPLDSSNGTYDYDDFLDIVERIRKLQTNSARV